MKDTKRRLEWFSFYDHTGLEAHLERMAERGWLLDKIGNFTWHYRRMEPKKLMFSVCYFPRASSKFDPEPSEEEETFYDFCAHTGWTLAAASAQMQIFYNERPNPVPIDTDPALEIEAIHQSAKKSWLVSQLLLLAVGVINFGQYLWRLLDDPITTLSSTLLLFSLVCWPMLFLLSGADLATYFLWRRRALKAAEQGEFLATKSHPIIQKLALAVALVGLAWCLSYLRGGMLTLMVASLAGTFGIVFLVVRLQELLKQKKVPAGANRAVTFGACIALPLVMVVLVTALVLSAGGRGRAGSVEPPLTLADLVEQPAGGELDQSVRFSQSPLLAVLTADQYLWLGRGGAPAPHWLQYTVTVVKAPCLYGICKNHLLSRYDDRGDDRVPEGWKQYYTPIDPAPWGAEEAYQMYRQDMGPDDSYLLCYPGRIVEFATDWEPTPEQMAVAAEKLGGQ